MSLRYINIDFPHKTKTTNIDTESVHVMDNKSTIYERNFSASNMLNNGPFKEKTHLSLSRIKTI